MVPLQLLSTPSHCSTAPGCTAPLVSSQSSPPHARLLCPSKSASGVGPQPQPLLGLPSQSLSLLSPQISIAPGWIDGSLSLQSLVAALTVSGHTIGVPTIVMPAS